MATPISEVVKELESVKVECLALLADVRTFYTLPAPDSKYPDTYKLLVIPLLYAAWQRCFTLCNAIAWRRLRDETLAISDLTDSQRSVWLLQTPFYKSFIDTLLTSASVGSGNSEKKLKKFHQPTLATFLGELNAWERAAPDVAVDSGKLVMTFSNVNLVVVNHNAKALGIDTFPMFQALKLGSLHSLVGFRNDIGHGGTISPPPDEEFTRLWNFTEKLIADYAEMFQTWVVARFPPPPLPPSLIERLKAKACKVLNALKQVAGS